MARHSSSRIGYFFTLLLALGVAFGTAQAGGYDLRNGPGAKRAEKVQQIKQRLRSAIQVHRRHVGRWLQIPDVVGSGTGIDPDGRVFLRIFTANRKVLGLPRSVEGLEVEHRVSGRFYALRGTTCEVSGDNVCQTTERWPLPVPTGVSVGHPDITAGTIGARVTDGANVFVLSNNHVLADVNQANLGDPILQPGSRDGGTLDDTIANLTDFEPISICTGQWPALTCPSTNTMDAAIALSYPAELAAATPEGEWGSVVGYGTPSSTLHPAYGDPDDLNDHDLAQLIGVGVQKLGRTTGLTVGTVDTVDASVYVCYDALCEDIGLFADQIFISPGTFSAGGDSGSLIVTNDGSNQLVGLLFAGSDTHTIANRIDLVLSRFGVTVDEGDVVAPVTDVAVTGIDVPATLAEGEIATVTVTVENLGEQPVASLGVTLTDESVAEIIGTQAAPEGLAPGASAILYFAWTPATEGMHTLAATHDLSDDNPDNDTFTTGVDVLPVATTAGPQLQLRKVIASTDRWEVVVLDQDYGDEMVVVCSPSYDLTANGPAMVRVRNASGTSFEVGLGRPWKTDENGDFSALVHCMVVRNGVYTTAEHGVRMEAVKLEGFASSDNTRSWFGELQPYQNPEPYSTPVVVGQVVSPDTGIPPSHCPAPDYLCEQDWSVFWSRGTDRKNPPSSGALYVGRHTGEDTSSRPTETLMYVVVELGVGAIEGQAYLAGLGVDTVRGMDNRPPYVYALSGLASPPTTAIVTQAGMDGFHGGWAVLYGQDAISATQLKLGIDEDWYGDAERWHTTEQVGYVVFQ